MAHRGAPDGIGAQGPHVAGIADAAHPRRRAVTAPPPRDYWAEVIDNRLPRPSASASTNANKKQKKFTIKDSELTGDKEVNQRTRDYIESLNDIEQERVRYLELKSDGANDTELAGKLQCIEKMVSAAKKVRKTIHRLGGNPRKVPRSLTKEPK